MAAAGTQATFLRQRSATGSRTVRRVRIAAVAIVVLSATACGGRSPDPASAATPCAAENQRYCAAAEGDLLDVTLDVLHPTQPSLGYDEVYSRLGRYTIGKDASDQLFDAWCTANGQKAMQSVKPGASISDRSSFTCTVPLGSETAETTEPMKTAVIGPGGQVYLTDGHHTLTSFWEVPGGGPSAHVRLKVTGNLSKLAPEAFWQEMQTRGWTWLRDADGKTIAPEALPKNLGLKQFANDQYRGVLFFARDIGYSQDDNTPAFQEFYWGHWLRTQTDPSLNPNNFPLNEFSPYLTLVGNVAKAMVALPGDAKITDTLDANALGRLDAFGEKAFEALSQPLSAPKPGKLAIALEYKRTH